MIGGALPAARFHVLGAVGSDVCEHGLHDAPRVRVLVGAKRHVTTIVRGQAGEVNTGAFDPLTEIPDAAEAAGAWLHLDGAFGLWAVASPELRALVAGLERADSWTTDAHKSLNVPYDSGIVFCAHPSAHRAAMAMHAEYLIQDDTGAGVRDQMDWVPEFSRRARGFAVMRLCARSANHHLRASLGRPEAIWCLAVTRSVRRAARPRARSPRPGPT